MNRSPIRTSRHQLPVPFGQYWIAYRQEWFSDLPVGQGRTEQDAIESLLAQERASVDEEENHND